MTPQVPSSTTTGAQKRERRKKVTARVCGRKSCLNDSTELSGTAEPDALAAHAVNGLSGNESIGPPILLTRQQSS